MCSKSKKERKPLVRAQLNFNKFEYSAICQVGWHSVGTGRMDNFYNLIEEVRQERQFCLVNGNLLLGISWWLLINIVSVYCTHWALIYSWWFQRAAVTWAWWPPRQNFLFWTRFLSIETKKKGPVRGALLPRNMLELCQRERIMWNDKNLEETVDEYCWTVQQFLNYTSSVSCCTYGTGAFGVWRPFTFSYTPARPSQRMGIAQA